MDHVTAEMSHVTKEASHVTVEMIKSYPAVIVSEFI